MSTLLILWLKNLSPRAAAQSKGTELKGKRVGQGLGAIKEVSQGLEERPGDLTVIFRMTLVSHVPNCSALSHLFCETCAAEVTELPQGEH